MPSRPRKQRTKLPERPRQPGSDQKYYASAKWDKLRRWHRIDHPYCEACKKQGIYTPVEVVDHIIRIAEGGAEDDTRNFQSLCQTHHNQKSGWERHHSIKEWRLNKEGKKIPKYKGAGGLDFLK